MTLDEIYNVIAEQKPSVIYISGKTSTGKSTFGRRLRDDLGYRVIELEAILLEIVEERGWDEQSTFRKVLRESGESQEKDFFLQTTDQIISGALAKEKHLVIEGAVANAQTLQRILQPAKDIPFLYFHPKNNDIYIRNLTKRFTESEEGSYGGLPPAFWQLIDPEEAKNFRKTGTLSQELKNSIKRYAQDSQKESLARLDQFRENFKNITVVEI